MWYITKQIFYFKKVDPGRDPWDKILVSPTSAFFWGFFKQWVPHTNEESWAHLDELQISLVLLDGKKT